MLLGGLAVARLGTVRSLVIGSLAVIASNLMFMTLAFQDDPSLIGLAVVVSADNLAMGIAGTALIAYLSSLTSASYTATQYALFSSMYALPGKLLMGTSGFVVDAIGYPWFFVYTSSLGIPALVMLYFLTRPGAKRRRWRGGFALTGDGPDVSSHEVLVQARLENKTVGTAGK